MKCIENMPKKNRDPKIFDKVKCVQNQLNSIIESSKQKYYSRMIKWIPMIKMTSTKPYWSTLKMFLNNKKILPEAIEIHNRFQKRKGKYSNLLLVDAFW